MIPCDRCPWMCEMHRTHWTWVGGCADTEGLQPSSKATETTTEVRGDQTVVTKAMRYYGHPCIKDRGLTQGYLVSPTVFNLVVGAVLREVLL